MVAATYNGILNQNSESLPASCPTGNCTWPVTPSMAICGACSASTYTTSCFPGVCNSNSCSISSCNYTLPSGVAANLTDFAQVSGALQGIGFRVLPSSGAIYNSSDPHRIYIANFDVFGAPWNHTSHPVWDNSSTVSSECALWMCAKAFEAQTSNTFQSSEAV